MITEKLKFRAPKWRKGSGFYVALSLAVMAAGIGVWGSVSNSLNGAKVNAGPTQRNTIQWENYVTRPATQPTAPANVAAENIRDERTTPAAQTAITGEMPYTGNFVLPFGTQITKDFSNGEMVKSSTMNDWRVHNGVDFAGKADQKVLAIQDGTVSKVEIDPLWGVVVVIDHGNGILAKYCGLSENSTPQVGREVQKGEAIGVIAQVPCESADGIHLHFEVSVNGKTADPLAVMNKTGANEN